MDKSPTRQYVEDFSKTMEYKLSLNRHKGDREGWLSSTISELIDRLYEEVEELKVAIAKKSHKNIVKEEAADVANFCMMIADKYGN